VAVIGPSIFTLGAGAATFTKW